MDDYMLAGNWRLPVPSDIAQAIMVSADTPTVAAWIDEVIASMACGHGVVLAISELGLPDDSAIIDSPAGCPADLMS